MATTDGERIAALEAQIAALQRIVAAIRPIVWRGVWRPTERYRRGSFVTKRGGLWHADRDDPGKPGDEDSGWTLAVKSPRDERRPTNYGRRPERKPGVSWVNR